MAFRRALGAGLLGLGLSLASLAAVGASGCGGSSVQHVSDGGTGGGGTGYGGSGSAGTGTGGTGSSGAPCLSVGQFAGAEYVDWNVSPDLSCAGMTVFCYAPSDPVLNTCLDGGVPEPSIDASSSAPAPAPPQFDCPNVRVLCSTVLGCCESIDTLVAGPRVTFDDLKALPCCYLAQPGFHSR